jgi:hypothetical protein
MSPPETNWGASAGGQSRGLYYWEGDGLYVQFRVQADRNDKTDRETPWAYFGYGQTDRRLGRFTPGVWHDFVLHVLWSRTPNQGFVEAWYDGVKIVPLTTATTLGASPSGRKYMRLSVIHGAGVTATDVVYFDGMRDVTTFEEAMAGALADGGVLVDDARSGATGETGADAGGSRDVALAVDGQAVPVSTTPAPLAEDPGRPEAPPGTRPASAPAAPSTQTATGCSMLPVAGGGAGVLGLACLLGFGLTFRRARRSIAERSGRSHGPD